MVHNGIEYGDMQLICEAYLMLKDVLGLSNAELYDVFDEWNRGELQSYLIEISRDIFSVKDDLADGDMVDKVLDSASNTFRVRLSLANAGNKLPAGLRCKVDLPEGAVAEERKSTSAQRSDRANAPAQQINK